MKTKMLKLILINVAGFSLVFLFNSAGLAQMEGHHMSMGGANFSHPSANFSRPSRNFSRPSANFSRPSANFSHSNAALSHQRGNFVNHTGNRGNFHRDADRGRMRDHDFDRHHGRSSVVFFGGFPYYYYPDDYSYYQEPLYGTTQLALTDIIAMTNSGIPDDEIISQIQQTGSVFYLTSQTIAYLKQNNVSDRVIDAMLATEGTNGSYAY